jgi:hypothetical protein
MKDSSLQVRFPFVGRLLLVFFVALLGGCSAGIDDSPNDQVPTVTTTIYGQVVDESGAPVIGAAISSGSVTATTDSKGLFILKHAVVPQSRLVVTAKKAGYFTAARAETPATNGATRTKLFLMSNAPTYSVSAASGGTVAITGGASVKFEAGSFRTSSGAAYSGTVRIAARYLDPESWAFADHVSDGAARMADGTDTTTIPSGMLRVEITDESGVKLQLDPAKPATISYPKPTDASAPQSMPLWYFDESLGLWKENGTATLQGNAYVGTVTHFTDWYLGYCWTNTVLEFRIVCNDAPIEGVAVKIVGASRQVFYTTPDGIIRIHRIPFGRDLQIVVRPEDNNGEFYLSQPVTVRMEGAQNKNLGDIVLSSPCPAVLQGSLVDCNDKGTEGLVLATSGTTMRYMYTTTGQFALHMPAGRQLQVETTDASGNHGTTLDLSPLGDHELRQLGTIKLCGALTNTMFDIDLGATGESGAIGLSPDGSLVAVNLGDGRVLVYETAGRTLVASFTTSKYGWGNLHFSSDNKRLLTIGGNATMDVFDLPSKTLLCSVGADMEYGMLNAYISDDGKRFIARAYDNTTGMGVYDETGTMIKQLHPADMTDSANFGYMDAEKAIVYHSNSGKRVVWSIENDAEIRSFDVEGGSKYGGYYSEDGERYANPTDPNPFGGNTFAVYNTRTAEKVANLTVSALEMSGWSTYGSRCLTKERMYGSEDVVGSGRALRSFLLSDGSPHDLKTAPPDNNPYGFITASRNDSYLATGIKNGIRLWKLK